MSSAAVRSEAMRLVDGVLASSAPVYDVLALFNLCIQQLHAGDAEGGFVASVGGNRGAGNIKKLLVWRPPQQQQPASSQ